MSVDIVIFCGICIIGVIYLCAIFNRIIDRMNYLADSLRECIDTHAWEIKHLKLKNKMAEIDNIRDRVLHSAETYEPNDVLDIIDKITEIIESEDEIWQI